jgi:hypothetical protein
MARMESAGEMSRSEFRMALRYALDGCMVTDTGSTQAVQDALDAVAAAAPHPPRSLINAARAAYRNR